MPLRRWPETAVLKGADARPNTSDGGPRSGTLQERSAQGNNQTPEAGDWIAPDPQPSAEVEGVDVEPGGDEEQRVDPVEDAAVAGNQPA